MLNLQYFGHLMQRADSLEKTLMLGEMEGRRKRGQQKMRLLDGITDSADMSLTNSKRLWRTGKPGMLQSMGSQNRTQLNKTELLGTLDCESVIQGHPLNHDPLFLSPYKPLTYCLTPSLKPLCSIFYSWPLSHSSHCALWNYHSVLAPYISGLLLLSKGLNHNLVLP